MSWLRDRPGTRKSRRLSMRGGKEGKMRSRLALRRPKLNRSPERSSALLRSQVDAPIAPRLLDYPSHPSSTMAGDDDDLYGDLYATGEQDSQQPTSSTLSSDDFGLDEPSSSTFAANKPAASSGGSSFIPAASSTSGGAKSSFIPAASGSSSSTAAKGGSFIPPAASNMGTGSPMPQPQQSIHQQVQQHSQQQPTQQQQPQQNSLPQPLGTGQASSSDDG